MTNYYLEKFSSMAVPKTLVLFVQLPCSPSSKRSTFTQAIIDLCVRYFFIQSFLHYSCIHSVDWLHAKTLPRKGKSTWPMPFVWASSLVRPAALEKWPLRLSRYYSDLNQAQTSLPSPPPPPFLALQIMYLYVMFYFYILYDIFWNIT